MSALLLPGDYERLQAIESAANFMVPVGVDWVENDVLGVAEAVARYWPNLRVASCTSGHDCLRAGHWPHVVYELCKDGVTREVFGLEVLDWRLIERLHRGDSHRRDFAGDSGARHNMAVREQYREQRYANQRDVMDFAADALVSRKSTYSSKEYGEVRPDGYRPGRDRPGS